MSLGRTISFFLPSLVYLNGCLKHTPRALILLFFPFYIMGKVSVREGLPTTHWPRAGCHRAGALCLVGGAPGPRAERGPDVAGNPSAGLDA